MGERRKLERGFTILELMIVVAIIGILAVIAIPRFALILEKAREGATKGNISAIRGACKIYYSDWGGKWPSTLDADAQWPFSRYIDVMPMVKCSRPTDTALSPEGRGVSYLVRAASPSAYGVGWAYDSTRGDVYVNSIGLDSRSDSYSTY
jgi:prepilin-type N-terminal cleavage/methylation domain-containing protein